MKRFGLFLLVTMAAAIFTSCNDSDGDYPRLSAFASVKPLENNDFYVVLDDGKTVYPGDKSRIGSYKAEEDQRVVIYFNLLNNKVEGYDYNMALYYIQDIYSGGTKVVTTQEELRRAGRRQNQLQGGIPQQQLPQCLGRVQCL